MYKRDDEECEEAGFEMLILWYLNLKKSTWFTNQKRNQRVLFGKPKFDSRIEGVSISKITQNKAPWVFLKNINYLQRIKIYTTMFPLWSSSLLELKHHHKYNEPSIKP